MAVNITLNHLQDMAVPTSMFGLNTTLPFNQDEE
jgi:hypothetical protein